MGKRPSALGVYGAILLSAAGLAAFILLFIPRMDIYGWILAPVIFAVYQIPAALLYGLWKRRQGKMEPKPEPERESRENNPGGSSEEI